MRRQLFSKVQGSNYNAIFVNKIKNFLDRGSGFILLQFWNFSANADELYGDCIRKGTTEFNDKVKPHVKKIM